jgi:hypothetical protein
LSPPPHDSFQRRNLNSGGAPPIHISNHHAHANMHLNHALQSAFADQSVDSPGDYDVWPPNSRRLARGCLLLCMHDNNTGQDDLCVRNQARHRYVYTYLTYLPFVLTIYFSI